MVIVLSGDFGTPGISVECTPMRSDIINGVFQVEKKIPCAISRDFDDATYLPFAGKPVPSLLGNCMRFIRFDTFLLPIKGG
jgi:hypothetical protein